MEKTVYFRSFEDEDADLIYQWMNDDELKRLSVGVNRRLCKEEAADWVKARKKDSLNQKWWAICAIDSNLMIGYMSLTNIHYVNSTADFSGIVIGNPDYQDGLAWIESYLFLYEFAFERLNLNRVYGTHITEHQSSTLAAYLFYRTEEGVLRQAVFKNGRYYDLSIGSILKTEYFYHKSNGDYEWKSLIRRFREYKKMCLIK